MMHQRPSPRTWIWIALVVQTGGLALDAVWHWMNRDFEAVTVSQMVRHLATVHLLIYIGVASVLVATSWRLWGSSDGASPDWLCRSPLGAASYQRREKRGTPTRISS
jgi:hypothetical protein